MPASCTCEQQIGYIGTSDEQYKGDRPEQNVKSVPDVTDNGLAHTRHRDALGLVHILRIKVAEALADRKHFGLRLREGNTRSQTRGSLEEMALVDAVRISLKRYPHLGVWFCGESRRYNADDRVRHGIEVYGAAEDLRIGAKVGSPEIF